MCCHVTAIFQFYCVPSQEMVKLSIINRRGGDGLVGQIGQIFSFVELIRQLLNVGNFFFQAILGRKFVSSEVFELMQSVCQLSITSDSEHTRQQCRQVGWYYDMS